MWTWSGEMASGSAWITISICPRLSIPNPISDCGRCRSGPQLDKDAAPVDVDLFDGSRHYIRRHHPAYEDLKNPRFMSSAQDRMKGCRGSHPIEEHWPYTVNDPAAFQIIQNPPEELAR